MLSLSMIFESLITIKNLSRCAQNALSTMLWRGKEGTRKKCCCVWCLQGESPVPVKGQRGGMEGTAPSPKSMGGFSKSV